jgi:hypothetical protein
MKTSVETIIQATRSIAGDAYVTQHLTEQEFKLLITSLDRLEERIQNGGRRWELREI